MFRRFYCGTQDISHYLDHRRHHFDHLMVLEARELEGEVFFGFLEDLVKT